MLEAFWTVGSGDDERARTVAHRELNAHGLEMMQSFDVLDGMSRIECPTLVCAGDVDPIMPVAAAREMFDALAGTRATRDRGRRRPLHVA